MKHEISKLIGSRIKELRLAKKLSQEKLSLELIPIKRTSIHSPIKVNREYISKIETGKRNISVVSLERVCEALDITMFDFFNSKLFK